jgi:hypothetical protein
MKERGDHVSNIKKTSLTLLMALLLVLLLLAAYPAIRQQITGFRCWRVGSVSGCVWVR